MPRREILVEAVLDLLRFTAEEVVCVFEGAEPVAIGPANPVDALARTGCSDADQLRVGAGKMGVPGSVPGTRCAGSNDASLFALELVEKNVGEVRNLLAKAPGLREMKYLGATHAREICHGVDGTAESVYRLVPIADAQNPGRVLAGLLMDDLRRNRI